MKKIVLSIVFSLCIFITNAQWDNNPASVDNPVITTGADEQQKIIVTDGANGAIVISQSYNNFVFPFLFAITAQKINTDGVVQWGSAENPKLVYSKEGEVVNDYLVDAISDGNGGAYIAWQTIIETPTDTITNNYIQHINSSGNTLWASTGLKVNSDGAGKSSSQLSLCQDGSGGVVVAWDEDIFDEATQFTTFSQVYAQRYNSAGAKQWGTNGVQVCTANGIRAASTVINDGNGGFVIYFADARSSNHVLGPDGDELFDNIDIYAQRLNTSGALSWAAAGVPVVTTALNQVPAGGFGFLNGSGAVADGAGGSIVLFEQYKLDSGNHNKYFAQRLNGSGTKQWAAAGVSVCNIDSSKFVIKTLPDGASGMVAVWSDYRNSTGGGFDGGTIYAQRVVAAGTANWTTDGVNVLGAGQTADFYTPDVTDDGSGNYIFTWSKFTFTGSELVGEVVARKLNNSGVSQWGANPKTVCNNPLAIAAGASIVKSNNGNSIIAWMDQRNNGGISLNGVDIYAAKLGADGSLGGSTPVAVTYTFTGNGNWNVAGNWTNNTIPPSTLPDGSTIVINHSAGGQCVLNVSQTVAAGATLTVMTGKNLVVQGQLNVK